MAIVISEASKELLEFRERLFATSEESIEWFTAPLIVCENGKCVDHRTGILVQVADMHFVITAAHGLLTHHEAGRSVHVVMPQRGLAPVPLLRETFWSTKDNREDISVAQLDETTVAALSGHYRFIGLTHLMSRRDRRQGKGLYLLMGFPTAMMAIDETGAKRQGTWKYLTKLYSGVPEEVEQFDPNLHIVLDYERDTRGRDGQKVHPPGLSGCGIWFVGEPSPYVLLTGHDFKLVGIQTSWHKGREYAKGTWVDDVLLILWKHFPSTHRPMELHGICF